MENLKNDITFKQKKKFKKTLIIALCVVVFVAVIVPAVSSVIMYEQYLDERYTTDETFRFSSSDFPGLQAQRYEFTSDSGQTLIGYRYYREEQEPEAVVIMAHGFGGGGHNTYMDCADFFASNGFTLTAREMMKAKVMVSEVFHKALSTLTMPFLS